MSLTHKSQVLERLWWRTFVIDRSVFVVCTCLVDVVIEYQKSHNNKFDVFHVFLINLLSTQHTHWYFLSAHFVFAICQTEKLRNLSWFCPWFCALIASVSELLIYKISLLKFKDSVGSLFIERAWYDKYLTQRSAECAITVSTAHNFSSTDGIFASRFWSGCSKAILVHCQ